MFESLTTRHLRYHATGRPLSAMEIDYPNGSSTGAHSHPRAQLLYAIEGVMVVRSSEGCWVVPPNRAVWIVAGLEHEVRMCGVVKIRTVWVDEPTAQRLPRKSCLMSVSPLLRELIVEAVQVPLDYVPGTRHERLMHLLLDELKVLDVPPLHLPMPSEPRLRAVCEFLAANPDDSSTAAQLANQLGITAKTLHRLFAKETGLTFGQWRQQARLLIAMERLARGERVIDAALDSGYASQSAFAAMFRKHFGVAPRDLYR
jgi:AraC-like DNA-binding protein/mannose-6-phosphate isomerase-like protein (cupin superfamily)